MELLPIPEFYTGVFYHEGRYAEILHMTYEEVQEKGLPAAPRQFMCFYIDEISEYQEDAE